MALVLPQAPDAYDKANEQVTRGNIQREDARNLKVGLDIDPGSASVGLILRDSAGTRWRLSIDTTGALVTTSL